MIFNFKPYLDLMLHFSASYAIYMTAYLFTDNEGLSFLITLVLGAIKELFDHISYKGASWLDFLYDVLGTIIAAMVTYAAVTLK